MLFSRLTGEVLTSPLVAPLQLVAPNAALSFFLLGLAFIGFDFGRRQAAILAVLPGLLGAATLFEAFIGGSFGVDEFLVGHLMADERLAPITALCFILSGLSLPLLASRSQAALRNLALAIAGSLLLAIGGSTLLGFLLELPAAYRWGGSIDLSPATAGLLMVVGIATMLLAWREHQSSHHGAPGWLPLPVVISFATLTIILWAGLREREVVYLGATTQTTINTLASSISLEFERQSSALERIARRWGQLDERNPIVWEADAVTHLNDAPGGRSLSWVDSEGHTVWSYPSTSNLQGNDQIANPVRARALVAARESNAPTVSNTISLQDGGSGFVIYVPIRHNNLIQGYVAAEYAYTRLFAALDQRLKVGQNYTCYIQIGSEKVYDSSEGLDVAESEESLEMVFTLYERRLRITLEPSPEYLRRNRRYFPELALAAGFGITLLLGLSVHLARAARTGLRAAETSNRQLQSENEERRRVEAMLKVSDERLRLALDSTQIGIFEWNLGTHQLYYSPGLWSMLDYEPGQIAATEEAWTALIHPDDLPGYLAKLQRQRDGVVPFIDPEYRVRTARNEWRWLYVRARTVSLDSHGRATRVIGTLQDITERKQTEEALRASQAATRKLSLVASRTDSIVIIGSPKGTIEWVNDSFTRVMEYQLEEIVGQNPAAFMVGPDTSPKTIRRIRAAMARGEGVSCDVVNYSKSGRKYHLQLEIQPVRNDTGGVETFIAILSDITPRVETETALRRAKAEADAASRSKSEFLASMSHEIRTPMNGVIGMTSLLLDTPLSPDQRDSVNIIRTSGEALLTIINDILDFSKIESGKMELENIPFDLPVCIEETLDLFSVPASVKKLDLVYDMEPDVPPWILGDVTRVRQVLVNLVNNAVKFTPSGSIAIEVRRLPDSDGALLLEFTVRDTGIGIPPDRVDRLFKPFSQVDSSTTRKYGGTGLGLAICHRLCSLMGGGVRVESVLGQGSAFIFTVLTTAAPQSKQNALPPIPPALAGAPVVCIENHLLTRRRLIRLLSSWGAAPIGFATPAEALSLLEADSPPIAVLLDAALLASESGDRIQAVIEHRRIPTELFLRGGANTQPFGDRLYVLPVSKPVKSMAVVRNLQTLFQAGASIEANTHSPLEGRLLGQDIPLDILLVEDNAVNQKVALRFLERLGYRADAVANGIEAIATMEARDYQLVFMDIQMPEMDGFEASREIRRRLPSERQPTIIALTANALQGDRDLCLAAGMNDYITKPVKLHEISDVIRRHFRKTPA